MAGKFFVAVSVPCCVFCDVTTALQVYLDFSAGMLSFQTMYVLCFVYGFEERSTKVSDTTSGVETRIIMAKHLPFDVSLDARCPVPVLSTGFLYRVPHSSGSSFGASPK